MQVKTVKVPSKEPKNKGVFFCRGGENVIYTFFKEWGIFAFGIPNVIKDKISPELVLLQKSAGQAIVSQTNHEQHSGS